MKDDNCMDNGENTEDTIHGSNEEENFADLLADYEKEVDTSLGKGDRIKGEIIAISNETVFIDIGSKIDGAVDKSELRDEEGNFSYSVGDEVELYIISASESEIILSRSLSGAENVDMLIDAQASRIPVAGKVTGVIKGGFSVEISKKRAFCPVSQMDVRYVETPEDYVGQTFEFLINRVENHGKNIVVSRRELLEQEIREGRDAFMATLEVGGVYEGKVRKLMDFGAFVELYPGVDGLVHVSEMSWSRIDKPREFLKEGEAVTVCLLKRETDEKSGQERLSLSMRQVSGNPWDNIADKFRAGDKVVGTATRCAAFGVFVELTPGIEGLVHISEMSYTKHVTRPSDMIAPGDTVSVMIKEIDLDKKRISLSMKDAAGDPWKDAENLLVKGKVVTGTLERKEPFGYFITLAPGITGLLPKSKINQYHDPAAVDKIKPGEPVSVIVESINTADRKVSLELSDKSGRDDWRSFSKPAEGGGLGSLGEKLQAALKQTDK